MSGKLFDHQLIMFVGTPGAGKSTLSRELHRQLVRRGISTSLLPEQDVYRLDVLQQFTEESTHSAPGGIDTLLRAIRALCAEWHASDTVWITDQFLPAFHWLAGKYPPEQVEAYAHDLAQILQPLRPLTVYLEAEVEAAWHRAVAERGQDWSDWMVTLFSSRDLPEYSGGPLRDLNDLLLFFAWIQRQSLTLLAHWPEDKLILPTTETPLDHVADALLRRIGLEEPSDSSADQE